MADQSGYKGATDGYDSKDVMSQQPPNTGQLPPYQMTPTYPQSTGGYGPSQQVVVTSQPAPANNVIMVDNQAPFQQRPSHGLAICTLIFAVVTLVITFPASALCTVPAIILSGLALARDYQVNEAKAYSMASLVLTIVFWVFFIIAMIIVVIVVVVAANEAAETHYDPWYPDDSIFG